MALYTKILHDLGFLQSGGKLEFDDFAIITNYLQSLNTPAEGWYRSSALSVIQNRLVAKRPQKSYWQVEPLTWVKKNTPVRWNVRFPPPASPRFTFVDMFSGIGGFRIPFQQLDGHCVFSSDIDPRARISYQANFGIVPFGDIRLFDKHSIPDHDVLLAGFPCQSFSVAGRRAGFEDTRGTLFFEIAKTIQAKHPRAFLLENVRGLLHHDSERTLTRILEVLRDELKYFVPPPVVLDARNFGVPQSRQRLFLVGFSPESQVTEFDYPRGRPSKRTIADIMEEKPVEGKYYLSARLLETLRKHRARHEAEGHGFGLVIHWRPDEAVAQTIVTGGMGRERNLLHDPRTRVFTSVKNISGEINAENIRRMTPREWARLQGFPDKFKIVVSDTAAYRQFANSVPVPVIKAIGKSMIELLFK